MISLVIGAGGLLLVLGGFLALLARAAGDAVAVLVIALGSVVITAIIVAFCFLLANGIQEVFILRA